jgi:peptidoglycan glycosyltransferase
VIRVSDAAILACTSAPDYDPVALASEPTMGEITETDPDEPLKFRPIQRLYQPGWAMAWVTAAEALEAGGEAGQALECDGAWRCGRKLYRCTSSHGRISLGEALQEGCRIAIQKTAQAAGAQRYRDFLKRIHLLDSASVYLRGETGRMPDFFNWRALENLAEAAIGEGAAALPPMSVARFFLSVARDGEVVQPYLVARIRSPSGRVYMEGSAKPLGQAFSQRVARQLCSLMAESARHLCHDVEPDEEVGAVAWLVKGASHVPSGEAWFVAVYPWSQPALLVLCVVERAGTADDAVHRGLSILNYARLLRLE